MRKMCSGMVAFRDGEEDILCVVAGYGLTPSHRQPGAQYKTDHGSTSWCNEQHMFSLSTSEYNTLSVLSMTTLIVFLVLAMIYLTELCNMYNDW